MPNVVKKLVSSQYEVLADSEGLLLVSMAGLTVAETETIRIALDEGGIGLHMVKNSLARRALAAKGYEFDLEVLKGNVAIAFGSTEATITAAKIFSQSEPKKSGKLALRAGVLEGNSLGPADAEALANVPDKDTLRSQIVGALQGPMRGLAAMLAGVPGGVARVLQAKVDAGGGGEPAEGEAAAAEAE